jgi:hypothetical protein
MGGLLLKFRITLLISLILIFLGSLACDNNNSGGGSNTDGLPSNPNDWVCPGSTINLSQKEIDVWCAENMDRGEPAPPAFRTPPPLADLALKNIFDEQFREFVRDRRYANELNWNRDLNWRMTGPYLGKIGFGEFFGVHSAAVRIFYSPEVVKWLCDGRQGDIPDGAMIVKEQHPINESLGIITNAEGCMEIPLNANPSSWTTYIKNKAASFDGWYQGSVRAESTQNPEPLWQIGNPLYWTPLL